jgi:hypothetical protein
MVLLVGRTYNDAHLAMLRYAGRIPELAEAKMVSTFQWRPLDGQVVRKVYVAPETEKDSPPEQYKRVILVLARNLHKLHSADKVIHQILENGTTEPVDVARLRGDIPF